MADFTQDRIDARDSIKEDGALVTITWNPPPVSGAPDAVMPAPVTVTAWAVQLEYNYKQVGTQGDSLIQVGDKQLLLAALEGDTLTPIQAPPAEARCIATDGLQYVVKLVKPLAPNGMAIMYDINIRRG